jgi:hypothetical protein
VLNAIGYDNHDKKISRFAYATHDSFIIKDPHANGSGEGGSRNGTKSVSFKPLKENGLEKKLHDGNFSLLLCPFNMYISFCLIS